MVQAANVSQMLQDSSSQFTVFSPVNSAIESAIANNAVICQTDNFLDQPCTSLNDLFNSTSLSELVMNYGEQKSIAWQVSNCCSSPLYSLTVPMPSSTNMIQHSSNIVSMQTVSCYVGDYTVCVQLWKASGCLRT